jgi:hypothetical protein
MSSNSGRLALLSRETHISFGVFTPATPRLILF